MASEAFDRDVDQHRDEYLAALKTYCKLPCITGQGIGVRESAESTAAILRGLGCDDVRIIETAGAPVVYGRIGQGSPTLLVYNHYDVQPPEPLEAWDSDPFGAEERDGKIYARGISDNRGDVLARVQAIASYRRARGELPLTVKFVIEGEEEIGSPSLPGFIAANRDLLAADGCLWEGGGLDEHDRFIISLGLKGVLHAELRARSSRTDLHSSLATIIPAAPWRITWALASLKDPDDHITVDGLMEHVRRPGPEEAAQLTRIPFDEQAMKADLQIPAFIRNLSGIALLEKHLYEPTCTIQGLASGYSGPGLKAVLPNEAMAKIEFRLVPDLEPDLVLDLLRRHLDRRGFQDVEIVTHAKLSPAKAPSDAPVARAAIAAARDEYGAEPIVYPVMAASGPMSYFSAGLGVPVVTGGGLWWHDARAHAPNESIRIADYLRGIKYIGRLIDRFAAAGA
ncbi:MAG TPA: M20/M25/M40 family metallo-hydrolase [Thermomicrobiaceae bacterium]|nr:M20/M25/M40 family metallo-hydrolase [Thermomicrobiaceae bacterium]